MITLLPHNETLYGKIVKEINNGHRKIFYSEATGLGKSFIFMKLVEDYFTDKRVLYIVPKVAIWTNLTSYPEFATLRADITMRTFASFNCLELEEYDAVFVDECHHMLSDIQGENVNKFLNNITRNGAFAFGFTATPEYHGVYVDEEFFEASCYGLDIFEAIEQGLLPKIKLALADIDLSKVPKNMKAVFSVSGTKTVLERVIEEHVEIDHWLAYFYTKDELNKAEHELLTLFPEYKIFKVHSELKSNFKTIRSFSKYKGKAILLSVSMLLEGMHVPSVGGVLLYRNVVTASTYMQIYGRLCDMKNKTSPVFIDMSNSILNIKDLNTSKSSRAEVTCERNIRDFFDVTAKSYWTIELHDYLESLKSKRVTWTEEEKAIVLQNPDLPLSELQGLLPSRSIDSIVQLRSKLRVSKPKMLWTDEDFEILKKMYNGRNSKELAAMLNKPVSVVRNKIRNEGLTGPTREWTDEEKAILKSNPYMSIPELKRLLPSRTDVSIRLMRKRLQLPPLLDFSVDTNLVSFILSNYDKMSYNELEKHTGYCKTKIKSILNSHGIAVKPPTHVKIWTDEEVDYILNHIKCRSFSEIAKDLGRTEEAVKRKYYCSKK